ncbi:hypothetical protein DBO85_00835 [Pseudomonas mangrovi]|uniref:Uncharacterized protein n=1 Tax=Pseudomonas mangrovi TaxID=2161748 RepID=A0A2T5PER6_9PSED|nr:hypothetical protein DBO85_00835 [Pseudomonas mangrovi]
MERADAERLQLPLRVRDRMEMRCLIGALRRSAPSCEWLALAACCSTRDEVADERPCGLGTLIAKVMPFVARSRRLDTAGATADAASAGRARQSQGIAPALARVVR